MISILTLTSCHHPGHLTVTFSVAKRDLFYFQQNSNRVQTRVRLRNELVAGLVIGRVLFCSNEVPTRRNPVCKAFHRICPCGNEPIFW